jgi:drug/metabolite transporter (DMT)-like permease
MSKLFSQYSLLTLTALGLVISQLLLKQGTKTTGIISLTSPADLVKLIRQVLTSPLLLLGYGVSVFTSIMWLVVLSRFEVSYAGPIMNALYYVFLLLASALLLRESVSPVRWLGVLFVIAGVLFISRSN